MTQGQPPTCTGETATWCPRCGDCRCPYQYGDESNGRTLDDPGCPLHAPNSSHGAAPAPDLRALVEEYGAAECTHGVAVASGPLDMPAPDEEAKVNATKAALLAAIDRALGRTAAPQAERVPCAGWVRVAPNRWHLTVGHLRATVYVSTTGVSWRVAVMLDGEHILSSSEVDDHTATSVAPAQLAAEDAIAELFTAGLRAIGR